jgi:hypothetical protein
MRRDWIRYAVVAAIPVALAVGLWFSVCGLADGRRVGIRQQGTYALYLNRSGVSLATRSAMATLIRFVDAANREVVFINPDHIRLVKPKSGWGAEILLDDKIFVVVAESHDAVMKALDHG